MIPFLFKKERIPLLIPKEMQDFADKLSRLKSKEKCLRSAYDFIRGKFTARKLSTFTKFNRLFVKDIFKLWKYSKKDKFLHCTQQNFLLRVLLIKSGKFKEKDIHLKNFIHTKFFVHQFLRVKVDKKWIIVDVWFSYLGVPFGKTVPKLFSLGKDIV